MPNTLKEWIARINEREMPIFKTTVNAIASLTARDKASASELSGVILRDPALTARILRFANSPYYSLSGANTSTVTRAVVMLGFESVRELSLSLAIIDSLLSNELRVRVPELMANAFHAAVQARAMAENRGEEGVEEIFIATLLQNLGEQAFYCIATEEEIAALREAMEKPGTSPIQAQKQVLGFPFGELTRMLATEWKLSPTLDRYLANPDATDGRAKCIRLGLAMADAVARGWDSEEVEKAARALAVFVDISAAEARRMLKRGARQAAEVARSYGARTVAALIPGGGEGEARETAEAQAVDIPQPDPVLQLRVLRELSATLRTRTDLNLVLEILLEGIHRGVGMDRAVFAIYVPLRSQVRAKYTLGRDAAALLESFVFPVDTGIGNPFSDILFGGGAGLWVRNITDAGFSQLITGQVRDILAVRSFFLTPIIVHGKPIGLFYADRQPSKRPLDAAAFESFEHMGQQACLSIEHITRQERR